MAHRQEDSPYWLEAFLGPRCSLIATQLSLPLDKPSRPRLLSDPRTNPTHLITPSSRMSLAPQSAPTSPVPVALHGTTVEPCPLLDYSLLHAKLRLHMHTMPRIAIARWHHLPEVRKEFFDQCSRHQQLGRELLDSQARASILLAEYAQLMLGNEDGEQAADGPIDPHASRGNGCPYNEEHRRYLQKSYSANERDLRYLMAEYQRMGRRRDEAGRALSDLKLEMMGEDATALVALTTDAMQAATEGKGGTETDESAEWDLEADRVSRAMLDGGTNRDDGMIVHRATGRAVQTIGTGTSYTDVA